MPKGISCGALISCGAFWVIDKNVNKNAQTHLRKI
jgi:hypothetical protein